MRKGQKKDVRGSFKHAFALKDTPLRKENIPMCVQSIGYVGFIKVHAYQNIRIRKISKHLWEKKDGHAYLNQALRLEKTRAALETQLRSVQGDVSVNLKHNSLRNKDEKLTDTRQRIMMPRAI